MRKRNHDERIINAVQAVLSGYDTGGEGDLILGYLSALHARNKADRRVQWRLNQLNQRYAEDDPIGVTVA